MEKTRQRTLFFVPHENKMGLIMLDPYSDADGNVEYKVYVNTEFRKILPAANLGTAIQRLILQNYRLISVTESILPGIIGYSFDDIESIAPGIFNA